MLRFALFFSNILWFNTDAFDVSFVMAGKYLDSPSLFKHSLT